MSEQLYRVCWQIEGEVFTFWREPIPPYIPPAITHEGDLETNAGSPLPCIFDDESGLCK